MTKEEKQLLLKDLCARLPYGVILDVDNGKYREDKKIWPGLFNSDSLWDAKPYLRPMSSMTEKEKKIMRSCGFELIHYDTGYTGFANENYIDDVSFRFMEEFLNSHHFDYRDLIPMGLALEAQEGMYKNE